MSHFNSTETNKSQKRFIEKFKSKLIEIFFAKASKTTTTTKDSHNDTPGTTRRYSTTSSNLSILDNSISSYYYGYITNSYLSDDTKRNKSIKSSDSRKSSTSNNVDNNVSHRMSLDSSNITQPVLQSLNSRHDEINPFYDRQLTQNLSFDQMHKFDYFKNNFKKSLHTIDDENNFFDVEFMTNYISYILMDNLSQSIYLKSNNINLVTLQNDEEPPFNLLKQIARDIFLQSECEPCGLKGCCLTVYLAMNDLDESPQLLSQFRFDQNSYLTTFNLDLILTIDSNLNDCEHMTKSFRNFFNFKTSEKETLKREIMPTCVYLNGEFYVKKFKLY
ncbi:unnamed protein product [Brachionus calyciflorus]|uniref:Uncharacterized protein n=1 Tax=Brachionus calyciflorus TaxID=104777 RepID=A0A814JSC4_9BILA|nr:unnamed protein product [Brachionus calyciflorus]